VVSQPLSVPEVLRWLERRGTKRNRDGMARYGIRSARAFGVSGETMRPLAKRLGRDHGLAARLWDAGWHETRILASLVDEPGCVTPAQMDRWARAFDNWAVCDSVCFHLFDRTPHAWTKAKQWSRRDDEFVKRAAFALLAGLAVHDKQAPDRPFLASLRLIERAASDDRNFVKKAVNWALRQIGKRNLALNAAALALARRLVVSPRASVRWVGKDAARELGSAAVKRRLSRRGPPRSGRPPSRARRG
jgi:3-methyladenine DNA glycosylase AlkD